eukprot:Hpha_TRINITY_DN14965_c1_g1::TRINITY_DN14965_c1_g1_i2::g.144027::m.144027
MGFLSLLQLCESSGVWVCLSGRGSPRTIDARKRGSGKREVLRVDIGELLSVVQSERDLRQPLGGLLLFRRDSCDRLLCGVCESVRQAHGGLTDRLPPPGRRSLRRTGEKGHVPVGRDLPGCWRLVLLPVHDAVRVVVDGLGQNVTCGHHEGPLYLTDVDGGVDAPPDVVHQVAAGAINLPRKRVNGDLHHGGTASEVTVCVGVHLLRHPGVVSVRGQHRTGGLRNHLLPGGPTARRLPRRVQCGLQNGGGVLDREAHHFAGDASSRDVQGPAHVGRGAQLLDLDKADGASQVVGCRLRRLRRQTLTNLNSARPKPHETVGADADNSLVRHRVAVVRPDRELRREEGKALLYPPVPRVPVSHCLEPVGVPRGGPDTVQERRHVPVLQGQLVRRHVPLLVQVARPHVVHSLPHCGGGLCNDTLHRVEAGEPARGAHRSGAGDVGLGGRDANVPVLDVVDVVNGGDENRGCEGGAERHERSAGVEVGLRLNRGDLTVVHHPDLHLEHPLRAQPRGPHVLLDLHNQAHRPLHGPRRQRAELGREHRVVQLPAESTTAPPHLQVHARKWQPRSLGNGGLGEVWHLGGRVDAYTVLCRASEHTLRLHVVVVLVAHFKRKLRDFVGR